MRHLVFALLTAACPLPALADTPMTPDAFERYTTGKTLYFGRSGNYYGVERYEGNRRVTWSFLDGRCLEGEWYGADDGQICFVYEDDPDPHCWRFFDSPGGLIAEFSENQSQVPLYEARERDDPMLCYGPDVGA